MTDAQTACPIAFDGPLHPFRLQRRLWTGLASFRQWFAGLAAPLWKDDIGRASPTADAMAAVGATAPPRVQARKAAMSGDAMDRFQRTILPHLDAAYNFARFLTRDADAAQDIVQEAFLRAYRGFDGFRDGDARAWTFTIVRNCYHAWLQEGRRKARFEQPMATAAASEDALDPAAYDVADDDTPEAALMRKSESQRVREVIAMLSEPMREVLVLRELEDLSYKQIADIIDAPIGTVMSRLARARRDFGDAWRSLDGQESAG